MPKCLVCEKEKDAAVCHIIVLTEEERAHVENPQDEYVYCKPCWRILSDPVSGPALMSGIAQHHLRDAGVAEADTLALKFRQELTARALRKS